MNGPEPVDAPGPHDVRPLVGSPVSYRGIWIFSGLAVLGGTILFATLENHRAAISAPAIAPAPGDANGMISSPPQLTIPPDYGVGLRSLPQMTSPFSSQILPSAVQPPTGRSSVALPQVPPPPMLTRAPAAMDPDALAAMRLAGTLPYAGQASSAAGYESDRGRPVMGNGGVDASKPEERVLASRFANPATTVPKGTVIQAVLETALDSTRPGFARAIVSRDVYAFDGTKVLIGKGSRLIGEYKADLASGQNRALIQWQRLTRPDGVVANLDSPSADPLGRAGVKGKVNSHFLARFGGAILQSALDIGTQVGVNEISKGAVIYAVPLTTQAVPTIAQDKVAPTLTVRQGTSVSVFVARDLDFSPVEQ